MKPSDFISKTNAEKLNGLDEDEGEAKFLDLMKELDSCFIDKEELEKLGYVKIEDPYKYSERLEQDAIHKFKEELKEKIKNKMLDYTNQLGELSYTQKYKLIKQERLEELKEILKLLE